MIAVSPADQPPNDNKEAISDDCSSHLANQAPKEAASDDHSSHSARSTAQLQ